MVQPCRWMGLIIWKREQVVVRVGSSASRGCQKGSKFQPKEARAAVWPSWPGNGER